MSKYNMKPFTAEEKRAALDQHGDKISYSARYPNPSDEYEYRHVILPKPLAKFCPPGIVEEEVWRSLGIKQSPGWEMYMRHDPEPHVLLFRRPKNYDATHPPLTTSKLSNRAPVGVAPAVIVKQAK